MPVSREHTQITLQAKPLWTCPKCGRPFANRNQSHSCGRYTVAAHLKGKSERAIALYNQFERCVKACGPVSIVPAKTRIGFQVRMIFAAVNKLSDRQLDAHVILARRLEHPRFTRIESLAPRSHVHHFRLRSVAEIDAEVAGWLREAYRVGKQEHL
ncbi:MAG TPA: DUF5655 domain-containing protein [Anaerolineae bacterium]|nr:DUF5655 domain-containing protein [Anaerolineae bacterium]